MFQIVGAMAEFERELIRERIRAGMRCRRLEGLRLGREPLAVNREALVRDRLSGMSLTQVAQKTKKPVTSVKHMTIWGNHSATQYPDVFHALVDGAPAAKAIEPLTVGMPLLLPPCSTPSTTPSKIRRG